MVCASSLQHTTNQIWAPYTDRYISIEAANLLNIHLFLFRAGTMYTHCLLTVTVFGLREWHIVYRAVFGGDMFVAATVYLSVVLISR